MKNIFTFLWRIPKKCHCGQVRAKCEGPIPYASDAIWDRDACQVGAFREGARPDANYAVRNLDAH